MNEQEIRKPDFFLNFQEASVEAARRGQDERGLFMARRYRDRVSVRKESFGDFDCEWLIPDELRHPGTLLYLHGGGYVAGSLLYARGFGSALAVRLGMKLFSVGYRVAPEHLCPTAVCDALRAYEFLVADADNGPLYLAGESSGAGMALLLAQQLAKSGQKAPEALLLHSPWTDLSLKNLSPYESVPDPTLSVKALRYYADTCRGEIPADDERISPLYGDLGALPPALILAGGDELLLPDSCVLYRKIKEAGGEADLLVERQCWHAYMLYGGKAADRGFEAMERFISAFSGRSCSGKE